MFTFIANTGWTEETGRKIFSEKIQNRTATSSHWLDWPVRVSDLIKQRKQKQNHKPSTWTPATFRLWVPTLATINHAFLSATKHPPHPPPKKKNLKRIHCNSFPAWPCCCSLISSCTGNAGEKVEQESMGSIRIDMGHMPRSNISGLILL